MGKGHAWVNGLSIGRYWPSYFSNENDFSSNCDFRGATNCGKPTQRWYILEEFLDFELSIKHPITFSVSECLVFFLTFRYHIPRSYMNYGKENTLILFEEFGGTPLDIDIQTTRMKKVCAMPYARSTLELSCHDRTISNINFVSFGNPMAVVTISRRVPASPPLPYQSSRRYKSLFVKWMTLWILGFFVMNLFEF